MWNVISPGVLGLKVVTKQRWPLACTCSIALPQEPMRRGLAGIGDVYDVKAPPAAKERGVARHGDQVA